MKTSNVNQGRAHPEAIIRGWVSSKRAGSTGISVTDETGATGDGITSIIVIGGTVEVTDDGVAIITITDDDDTTDLTDPGAMRKYNGTGGQAIYTNTDSGSAVDFDLSQYNHFDVVLTANCTITFSNPPDEGAFFEWGVNLVQGGSGGYTVTWPAAVTWRDTDGSATTTAPTLATAVDGQDAFTLNTLDGGVTYGAAIDNGVGSVTGGGTSAADANIWRPVMAYDGTNWNVLVGGSGDAIMAYGPA